MAAFTTSIRDFFQDAWINFRSLFDLSDQNSNINSHILDLLPRTGRYQNVVRAFLENDLDRIPTLLAETPIVLPNDARIESEVFFTLAYLKYSSKEVLDCVLNIYQNDPHVLLAILEKFELRDNIEKFTHILSFIEIQHLKIPSEFPVIRNLNKTLEDCLNQGQAVLADRVLKLYPHCSFLLISSVLTKCSFPRMSPISASEIQLTPLQIKYLLDLCNEILISDLAEYVLHIFDFIAYECIISKHTNVNEEAFKDYFNSTFERTKVQICELTERIKPDRQQNDLISAFKKLINSGASLYFSTFESYLPELTLESQLEVISSIFINPLQNVQPTAVKSLFVKFLQSIPKCQLSDEQRNRLKNYYDDRKIDGSEQDRDFIQFALDQISRFHPEWNFVQS